MTFCRHTLTEFYFLHSYVPPWQTLGCCQLVWQDPLCPPPFGHFFPAIVTVDYFMRFLRPRIFMRILCLYLYEKKKPAASQPTKKKKRIKEGIFLWSPQTSLITHSFVIALRTALLHNNNKMNYKIKSPFCTAPRDIYLFLYIICIYFFFC